MVPDPYKALGLPHNSSIATIKLTYRKLALAYHPDQLVRRCASLEDTNEASDKFAAIADAYHLLSDPPRKQQYDYVYKYGGYDDEESNHSGSVPNPTKDDPFSAGGIMKNGKRIRNNGIGFILFDPISFIISGGSRKKAAVAGIQIPPRLQFSRQGGGGVRLAFSSGQFEKTPGGTKYVSKTTQVVQGKKYTRIETTTIDPDGRKEVVIEGDGYVERRKTRVPTRKKPPSVPNLRKRATGEDVTQTDDDGMPWYVNAWQGFREKITMCHNPCGMTFVQ